MNKKAKINFGFTTVELLVTVTVLAILAILVVTVINPIDLLKQGKDSNRVASLNAVNNALRFLTENEPGTFIGTSSVVYVSIPSTVSDCSNLGLPTLPSGWTYNCATSANLRKIDGTGWIPVNFSSLPAGSPISELPVDSKNSTSTRNYFTYVGSGSSWELAFAPEAEKNKLGGANNLTIKDGGQKASLFEIGKDLSLLPLDYGDSSLVGYWDFEEATGTIAYDRSGNGANGTWSGSGIHYTGQGLIGNSSGQFDGSSDYISLSSLGQKTTSVFSISSWVKTSAAGQRRIISFDGGANDPQVFTRLSTENSAEVFARGLSTQSTSKKSSNTINDGSWHNIVGLVNVPASGDVTLYLDGGLLGSSSFGSSFSQYSLTTNEIGRASANILGGPTQYWSGLLDNLRVYSRALSAAEVSAIFNGKN